MKKFFKKGIFFSLDALIAIAIVIMTIIALKYIPTENNVYRIHDYSEDIMKILASTKMKDVNNSYVNQLRANNLISNENNTVIEQIGEFWANSMNDEAKNLTKIFISNLTERYGVGLWIDGNEIYKTKNLNYTTIFSTRRIISGIKKGYPKEGYIARAWATNVKKNNTLIVKGDYITSSVKRLFGGNNGNKINITYDVYIPNDANITDAYWFIEAAWTDNKFKAYINDVFIPGSDASGSKLLTGLKSYFHPGHNTASIIGRYGSGGEEAGDDGASHIVINYTTENPSTIQNENYINFADVKSNCSIQYKKPIFIFGDIKKLEVNISAVGSKASLYFEYNGNSYLISQKDIVNNNVFWNDTEIKNAMNSNGITYQNISKSYFWFDVYIDNYHSRENFGSFRELKNESYVYVSYISNENIYGMIDINSVVPIYSYSNRDTGDFYRYLKWKFDLPNETKPLYVDSQLAWLYYAGSNPSQTVKANSITLYNHPPKNLIREFARFGYVNKSGEIDYGTNDYELIFGNGYSVNPFNSLVYYTFLIPSQVGYGDTFLNRTAALDDAKQRLNNILGTFVSAQNIQTNSIGVGRVPTLWGPSIAEVYVWK